VVPVGWRQPRVRDRLRQSEREWHERGDALSEAHYLRERLRVGSLDPAKLELAAAMGHEAARLALGLDPEAKDRSGSPTFPRHGHETCARAALAVARGALPASGPRYYGVREVTWRVLDVLEAQLTEPSPARREAVVEALNAAFGDPDYEYRPPPWLLHTVSAVVMEPESLAASFRSFAEAVARHYNPQFVRRVVRDELVPWALGTGDPHRTRGAARGPVLRLPR